MRFDIITLFPEMFASLNYSIPKRAQENNLLMLKFWNPRDFTENKHRNVDDRPYGGGPGMVMMAQPLMAAINAAKADDTSPAKVIYLSPQGRLLTQQCLQAEMDTQRLILICGRYEGIDERVIQLTVDEEWSIGDYVLSGGEFAAMVVVDALTRLQPGALGHEESAAQDSFSQGLLDYPHYTRPENFQGLTVPQVLLSGDHQAIHGWRLEQAQQRTQQRRPELLEKLGPHLKSDET